MKAIGRGLSYPLDAFAVSLGERPAVAIDGDPAESARWAVHPFEAGPEHSGTVVVYGATPVAPPRMVDPAAREPFAARGPATSAARTEAPPS